jgi:hypothetical protein
VKNWFIVRELKPLPAQLIGGNFLLTETDPGRVFTPEDLSSDQRLMAQSAGRFMGKDVLPNLDAHIRFLNFRAAWLPLSQR